MPEDLIEFQREDELNELTHHEPPFEQNQKQNLCEPHPYMVRKHQLSYSSSIRFPDSIIRVV